MKTISLLLSVLCVSVLLVHAQKNSKSDGDEELQKLALLSDLKSLALEIPKLDGPLARALADAEIADAAWTLDRSWAKTLLKDGYRLTYLSKEEQSKIGPEPPGTPPRPPTAISRARNEVRARILSVARRDEAFAAQLMVDSSANLTKDDRQMMYAQLARMALEEGDYSSAISSIQENVAIDPTQSMLIQLINDLAIKDRAAADKLILDYIAKVSTIQLVNGRLGRVRADTVLRFLVFPNSFFPDPNKRVPPPGPEVMRAYVRHVIDALTALEQREPGSLPRERSFLLTAWLPLNQYAPEFRERFVQLEALARTPGQDASLPTKSNEDLDQEVFRKKQTEALNNKDPSPESIDSAIQHEDFETARKLISKLPDDERKKQFTEKVNAKEAVSLIRKADLLAAQNLAERLTSVSAILQVYPSLVEGYAVKKDQVGASAAVRQAVRQLTIVDTKGAPPSAQFGMPAEFAPTRTERDGILSTLGKLASAVLPVDTLLAAEIVDEMVVRANTSQIDTSQGRTGIDTALFKSLASKDEIRARNAADGFKDRLRRVVTLAAIYQWKAKELDKRTPKKAA